MAQNVRENRNLYIGGSDIPVIMGISPFKTRFDLLLEKSNLQNDDFEGNEYTEYGNTLEPLIRDYINKNAKKPFVEDKKIIGDVRCHVDGYNGKDTILEIKTTSQIHCNLNGYMVYLVQLLFYMYNYNIKKGILAVYNRPQNFDETFDESRLTLWDVNIKDYKDLMEDILEAVNRFRKDLEKVKQNPFITEEELQPKELITLANEVLAFENKLAIYKKLEENYQVLKNKLYDEMEALTIKKWTTNNGVQITRVAATPSSTETKVVFDEEKFKNDFPDLYQKYSEETIVTKNGKKGYVKITLPKNKGEENE